LDQVRRLAPVQAADDLVGRLHALGRGGTAGDDASAAEAASPDVAAASADAGVYAQLAQSAEGMRRALGEWRKSPGESTLHERVSSAVIEIQANAGKWQIGNLSALAAGADHLLNEVHDGHVLVSDELFGLLDLVHERMSILVEQYHHGRQLRAVQDLIDSMQELVARHSESAGVATQAERDSDSDDDGANRRRRGSRMQHEMVRVRRDLMDNLVNFAGEVSIYRSRVEQQINSMHANLGELNSTVERLREQLRKFDIETEAQIASRYHEAAETAAVAEEFDPLEFDRFTTMQQLSRSMLESLGDIRSLEDLMLGFTRESETLLLQQARVNTELQETLMQTRMVQLVENAPRLRRVVRQTAAELGREANLSFPLGAHVEMDRRVVERLIAPLEHMLRNAVAHGIETSAERTAAGKPAAGSITISMSKEGSEVVLRVADDGRGIDAAGVRSKAIERGLMEPDAQLSDRDVMMFICEPGFSTAATLTQIAGRGVGMDVVSNAIRELGGALDIESEPGRGTRFTVRLPATLSVSRALLVNVGDETFAVPLLSIKGIERVQRTELARLMASEQPLFTWLGQDFFLVPLAAALGVAGPTAVSEAAMQPLLLAQSGDHRVALVVDRIIGSREVVIKSLGPQLSTLGTLSGATILSDGGVALVLELPALIRRGMARRLAPDEAPGEAAQAAGKNPTVMIVDDSITVRAVTKRLLVRHQMNALAAKDGVDALAMLEETIPDVILLDIEMPRMDGFELATHIRNSERLRHIPIVMITSRTGEKHRQRAMEIGVNLYMGKPFSENELLENIGKLVGRSV
jgi:chemosensory pili system protein ChpA (sensor histidine kinase/response regulator)